MSLRSFQRAVVDLTLAPRMASALRRGEVGVLAGYDLTARERERLLAIVRQPGISLHCSLSRGNRLEAIMGAFPMTCVLLRPVLRVLLDALWEEHEPSDYQLRHEPTAFAAFIARKIEAGELAIEYLEEILAYETACLTLTERRQSSADGEVEAIVEFAHPPDELLPPLSRRSAPPAGLRTGAYRARVKLADERFTVEVIAARA